MPEPGCRALRAAIVACLLATTPPAIAGEIELRPVEIVETRAVFGRIETRDVVPARSRIGGTLTRLAVTEGDLVTAGQSIASVLDDKLSLQQRAADARIRALSSELSNVRAELERAEALLARGAGTQQRVDQLRTQLEIVRSQIAAAEAERAVIVQQAAEGEVIAPIAGRVIRVPVTPGAVTLPGEQIALIGGGGYFLRLALPERHARGLRPGASVSVGEAGGATAEGRIAKVFPQIENGRVIADVDLDRPDGYFVGERVLVHVPIATRPVLAVPRAAVRTRSGIDVLTLLTDSGTREVAVVLGAPVRLADGEAIEILSGARAGDRVVLP
jgi:RND family efflux transporter MFP subunit